MNIFVLDENPDLAAQYQCNKHVVKMTIESAQILCAVLNLNSITEKSTIPYRLTHKHHPCTLWAASSIHNYSWMQQHADALASEYTKRFNKIHKTNSVLDFTRRYVSTSSDSSLHTPFSLCMPEEYKIQHDAVLSYKCFYIGEKSRFAKWYPRSTPPLWWPFEEEIKR